MCNTPVPVRAKHGTRSVPSLATSVDMGCEGGTRAFVLRQCSVGIGLGVAKWSRGCRCVRRTGRLAGTASMLTPPLAHMAKLIVARHQLFSSGEARKQQRPHEAGADRSFIVVHSQ